MILQQQQISDAKAHSSLYEDAARKLSKKFNRSVSLLTWGYNEEELVPSFLNKAIELLDETVSDWEIVFINDGSTDRTGRILDEYAKKDSRIVPIHNSQNLNVGKSCKIAIHAANKEYLFWQTVDWSYDISNLRIYLQLLEYYDVVQGVRPTPIRLLNYVPVLRSMYRIKSRSDNFYKAVVSLSNYYVLKILFGVKFQDFQNVSFYPTKLLQSVELAGESSFLNPECLIKTYQKGASYLEVPIAFIPRSIGEAKGTKPRTIIRSVIDIASNWLKWGWKFRFLDSITGANNKDRIHRVNEPHNVSENAVVYFAPLYKAFK